MSLSALKREDFLYQAYYCEENIWHLCRSEPFKNSSVVFIASTGDAFPMLKQRAMPDSSRPVYWDYHVVLLVNADTSLIIDFDTTLPFVSEINAYFTQSFIDTTKLADNQKPLFRVVPACDFVDLFSSDRSHMKTADGWLAPPPNWPLIENGVSNLSIFIDMKNTGIGEVLDYETMLARFT